MTAALRCGRSNRDFEGRVPPTRRRPPGRVPHRLPGQGGDDAQREHGVAVIAVVSVEGPGHRGTEVVAFGVDALAPRQLVGSAQRSTGLLGEACVVVARGDAGTRRHHPRFVEPFLGVLPERFQHLVPRRVGGPGLGDQHRLRHQTREPVDDVPSLQVIAFDDRSRRGRVEGPREHAQPVEHQALNRFQQPV